MDDFLEELVELENKITALMQSNADLRAENVALKENAGANDSLKSEIEDLKSENEELKTQLEESKADADIQREKADTITERLKGLLAKLDGAV